MIGRNSGNTRRFERFRAEQPSIDCRISGLEKGILRNISIGGVGICSSSPLEVGSKCVVGFNTPSGSYEIPSEVVWAERSGASSCSLAQLPVSMGLRFSQDYIEQSKDLVFALLNNN